MTLQRDVTSPESANREQPFPDWNADWFQDNDAYAEEQSRLEHYQHIRRIVQRELVGVERLLDVGNGGFFNYDVALADDITAVDLFIPKRPPPAPNVSFARGSLLDLPFTAGAFDCVLAQNVLHHVTGRNVRENRENLARCLHEMHRCTRVGGKTVIIESTVGRLFYAIEVVAFRPATRVFRRGHPITFQFTPEQILRSAEDAGFEVEEFSFIPRGRYILQFGRKWPTMLTPARPVKLVLRRAPSARAPNGRVKR